MVNLLIDSGADVNMPGYAIRDVAFISPSTANTYLDTDGFTTGLPSRAELPYMQRRNLVMSM